MQSVLRNKSLGVAAVLLATSVSSVAADPKDARNGSWSHCFTESEANENPAPENVTLTFEPAGKGSRATVKGVAADGSPIDFEYTAMYDGKDYPVKGGPWADTVSLKLVNARTTIRTDKKDGQVVLTLKADVSKDGKKLTITRKAMTPNGEQLVNSSVCERQS